MYYRLFYYHLLKILWGSDSVVQGSSSLLPKP